MEKISEIIMYAGREVKAVCRLRRTPQGEYRYRVLFADGDVDEIEVSEPDMLNFTLGALGGCAEVANPPALNSLPEDATQRNSYPMADGLLDYFPNALAEVSRVSFVGNQQHNPGEPMHWARGKSTDHGNKIMRHLIDAGRKDDKGIRHSARLAWRALALLQEELEREEGVPMSRGSTPPE